MESFRKFSAKISSAVGSPWMFIGALVTVAVWGLTGSIFDYSNTWQLVINTGTTIVTFLMVFLIQNTQNRDSRAIHLKLDELIKGIKGARDKLVDIEDLPDEILEEIHAEFKSLKNKYKERAEKDAKSKSAHGFLSQLASMLEKPLREKK